ncbi:MAG: hypothetical protein Q4D06_06460 [Coriobacteriia bacterium]|nr:hypothetical protein [Coriobacteriia bacterium]
MGSVGEHTGAKAHYFLRLQPVGSGYGRVDLPLRLARAGTGAAGAGGDGGPVMLDPHPGRVGQDCRYEFALLAPSDVAIDFSRAILTLNGEDLQCLRVGESHSQSWVNDSVMYGYEFQIAKEGGARPFNLVCGYARMELTLLDDLDRPQMRFVAKDIACQQESALRSDDTVAMVDALMGDPVNDRALSWMLRDGQAGTGAFSLVEGGFERYANRSVPTYLAIIEQGLNAAEAALPLIANHAASRIQTSVQVVEARHVRRMGGSEAQWLAAHPECLRPSAGGAVRFQGREYEPDRMASTQTFRSFNVYENQLCVSYLSSVVSGLAQFGGSVEAGMSRVAPLMAGDAGSHDRVLALCVAQVLRAQQARFLSKAEALRSRAQRLLRSYERMLPGVECRPLSSLRLVRTKIFKQIRAYSQLFQHIERFVYYGETIFANDGLAIEALRLDRIYETYVLHELLAWFGEHGYSPDAEAVPGGAPIYTGKYGYSSRVYADGSHVANVYHLRRGSVRVSLYYEPVAFADERQGHGMSLHRLVSSERGVYTPDYVLMVRRPDEHGVVRKQTFVLDAKYRPRKGILRRFAGANGVPEPSSWERICGRYARNLVDAQTGATPDAVWLLCGVQEESDEWPAVMRVSATPWERLRAGGMPSGLALVTPRHGLDALFAAMGLLPGAVEPGVMPYTEGVDAGVAGAGGGAAGAVGAGAAGGAAGAVAAAAAGGGRRESAAVSVEFGARHRFVVEETPVSRAAAERRAAGAAAAGAGAGAGVAGRPAVDPAVAERMAKRAEERAARRMERDEKLNADVAWTDEDLAQAQAALRADQAARAAAAAADEPTAEPVAEPVAEPAVEPAAVEPAAAEPEEAKAPKKSARQLRMEEQARKKREADERKARKKLEKEARRKKQREAEAAAAGAVGDGDAAAAASVGASAPAVKATRARADVGELVEQIVSSALSGNLDDFFDQSFCRKEIGINRPLLRKGSAKDYVPLPGHDGVFYHRSKLPTYANELSSYVARLGG